ncbi:MAG: hypothetical protein R3C54_10440 [Parvularculaceae bacterium]
MDDDRRGDTAVEIDTLKKIGKAITSYPSNFKVHRRLRAFSSRSARPSETGQNVDWASRRPWPSARFTLEGFGVRLSGQDSRRGTFSQRHAVFIDQGLRKPIRPEAP